MNQLARGIVMSRPTESERVLREVRSEALAHACTFGGSPEQVVERAAAYYLFLQGISPKSTVEAIDGQG